MFTLFRRFVVAMLLSCVPGLTLPASYAQDSIRIGAVLPLTGASVTIGEDFRRGILLGVEHVNAQGGVLGKRLDVIIEDSAGNISTALTAARKLAVIDKVPLVMGAYSSGVTIPMAQYLVKEGVVHLNIGSSSARMRDIGTQAFSIIGLDSVASQFAARDTYELGFRRVAVIVPNNAYGQGMITAYKAAFERLGGQVAAEILYATGQSTYRRELQQLARSQPDAYVYSAYGQEAAVINREAYDLGLRNLPWYALYFTMSLGDTPPDIARGQVGYGVSAVQGAAGQAYAQAFAAKYQSGFRTAYTGYGYDGVLITAAALEKAQSATPAALAQALRSVGDAGFEGVTGLIRLDEDGQRVDPPYDRLKYDSGVVPR